MQASQEERYIYNIERTEELLILRLKSGQPRFEVFLPSCDHVVLVLLLSKAIKGVADQRLTLRELSAQVCEVLDREC